MKWKYIEGDIFLSISLVLSGKDLDSWKMYNVDKNLYFQYEN